MKNIPSTLGRKLRFRNIFYPYCVPDGTLVNIRHYILLITYPASGVMS